MTPSNEPITLTEAVRAVVLAVIVILTVFNVVSLSTDQVGAILGLYAAGSVVLLVVARQKSTPTAKVAMTVDQAAELAPKPPAPSIDVDALAKAVGNALANEITNQLARAA